MSFNGREGNFIPLTTASGLTDEFKSNHVNTTKATFIGKDKIMELLNQTGAEGLRIYNGQDTSGNVIPVIVAADGSENDILDKVLDDGVRCPPTCGSPNNLNR